MQITDIHELIPVLEGHGAYTLFTWHCTCGAFAGYTVRSRAQAEIAHHEHRYPDIPAPSHTMIPMTGGFGGPAWICSCGAKSRPEGQQNDRRAQQTFTRHVTTSTLHWCRAYHKRQVSLLTYQERTTRGELINWHTKDPATRHAQTQYLLDQIL